MIAELRPLSIPSKLVWALMLLPATAGIVGAAMLFAHTVECLANPASFVQIPEWTLSVTAWSYIGWGALIVVAAFLEAHPPKGFYSFSGRAMAGVMVVVGMCLAALSD